MPKANKNDLGVSVVWRCTEHCVFLLRYWTVATACGSATFFILKNRPRHMDTQDTEHIRGAMHTAATQPCIFMVTVPGRWQRRVRGRSRLSPAPGTVSQGQAAAPECLAHLHGIGSFLSERELGCNDGQRARPSQPGPCDTHCARLSVG